MITFDKNDNTLMIPFVDIHTHQNENSENTIAVKSIFLQDFDPDIKTDFSVGLHPWHADKFSNQEIINLLENVANHPNLIAFGETGLDKKCNVDFEKQLSVFKLHIEIAEKTSKPLIIHCVNAWDELISIAAKTSAKMIIHGYNRNAVQTKQLLDKGFLFSIGKTLLNDNSKIFGAITAIPTSALFFETDENDFPIQKIYERASNLRETSIELLKKSVLKNFCDLKNEIV